MKNKPDSKKGRILNHFQSGRTLTQLQALRLYSHMRLAPCVCRLKKEGYDINKNMIYNLYGEGYAEYFMVKTK